MRLISVVIPVFNEGEGVVPYLDAVLTCVTDPKEVLVVHDFEDDSTLPFLKPYLDRGAPVRPILNTYGRGPANAIRFGLDSAKGDVAVVTMSDGSDDASQIDEMAELVRSGFAVVAASRYTRGGRQIGGPVVKRLLSRLAGVSLGVFAGVGTLDATSSFKAYDPRFVREVGVESREGFEVAIELVVKAKRAGYPVTEIPTTWRDRTEGESHFRTIAWIPRYLRWYLYAFSPMPPPRSEMTPRSK